MKHIIVLSVLTLGSMSGQLYADLVGSWEVGSGSNKSLLQFEFTNGNIYLYEVAWDGIDVTGQDLLLIVQDAQENFFMPQIETFSFGDVLVGQTIGNDSDSGFGTPPDYLDYWHYWLRDDPSETWIESMTGFSNRLITDGSWDGWRFNSHDAPSPIPGPGTSVVLLIVSAAVHRRRRALHPSS